MSLLLGIDLGTTKTTCIAVDSESGQLVASVAKPTDGNITSDTDRKRGRSEWNAATVLQSGFDCLTEIATQSVVRSHQICSLGVTGQQHGMAGAGRFETDASDSADQLAGSTRKRIDARARCELGR